MKRISKILLLLALVVLTALALVACGGTETLSVKEDRMPQLVHVQGEELNLADGVLVYNDGSGNSELAMNADGVVVSGYDKNTLGEQTITITYGEATTTVKITVVPRMTVDGYTADYLVGDEFDTDDGVLKITRNDGSSFTVILKSDKVKIEGFDSSAAGTLNLTAKYTNGDTVYTCPFTATVYAVDSVSFKAPNKTAYDSHDGELDVSGGYFTLSGKNGALKKDVPLDADIVQGFDISAVNETNTPIWQTLTVEYGGKTHSYKVELTYTDISLFKKNAQPLLSLNWEVPSDEEPELTEAQGTLALAMMEKYLDMSPAERTFITDEETLATARAAMSYGFATWADEIQKYNNAFAIEYGELVFKCESREALEAAIEGLANTDTPIYTYSPILLQLMETFKEEQVNTDYLFSDYPVIDNETYEGLVTVFEFMLDLDTVADKVGEDWRDDISVYATEIEDVYDAIVNSEFYSYEFAQFFYYVSMWRTEDDLFDFLYTYYYDVKEDVASIIKIANIRLPSELEEVFAYVYEAMSLMSFITNDYYFYQIPDTTEFFYSYYMAQKLSNEIITSEDPSDEMLQTLFYGLPLNSMLGISAEEGIYTFSDILEYINTSEGGYYSLCGALLDIPAFDELMSKYLDIVVKDLDSEEYMHSEEYVTDVKAMFALYTALTPSQQFNFLGILSTYYVRGYVPMAFDNVTEGYSELSTVFVDMVNGVYTDMFTTEAAKNAYLDLIFATEIYAQRYLYSSLNTGTEKTWLEDFTARINAVTAALGTMDDADKAIFTAELGALYTTYKGILDSYGTTGDVELGDWEDDIAELEEAVLNLELAYAILSEGASYYDLFFTAYERVTAITDRILSDPNTPSEIKHAIIYSELYSTSSLDKMLDPDLVVDPEDEVFWSYDYVISVYRSMYVNALLTLGGGTSLYDYYQMYGFDKFMNKSYDLIWAYMGSQTDDTDIFDKAAVLDVMTDFAEMDVNAQMMFILYIEGENGFYYTAISEFLAEEFTANTAAAGELLVALEMEAISYRYYSYMLENEAATEAEVEAAAESLLEAYAALETALGNLSDDEGKEFTDNLGDIYEIYKAIAESVTPAPVE